MGRKDLYEVDYITQCRSENGKRMFRVKWVGYPSSQNTWEPEEHLCPTLIKNYFEQEERKLSKKIMKQANHQASKQPSRLNLTIKDIILPDNKQDEVQFEVLKGTRKHTLSRKYLYQEHPQQLATFYLSLYIKSKNL